MGVYQRKTPADEAGVGNHMGSQLHIVASPKWTIRQAAIALLSRNDPPLNYRAAQFLGQMAVRMDALSQGQLAWLQKLLKAGGLPPLEGEA